MDKADIIGNIELLLAAKSTLNANQHESAGQIRAMLAFCIAMTQALPADRNSINAAFAVAAERFRPNEANAPKSVEHFDAVCELLTTALLVPSGISLPLVMFGRRTDSHSGARTSSGSSYACTMNEWRRGFA